MKYNVGDKVRIKPKFHFCSVDGFNNINMKDEFFNEYSRLPYCETVMTIGIVNKDFYILKEDRWAYKWTDEMIEGLVEETTETTIKIKDLRKFINQMEIEGLNDETVLTFETKRSSEHIENITSMEYSPTTNILIFS